jgi:anti-sigma-K factor RskA
MSTDIHTLTGAYALDALDPDEAAEFERHMSTCLACAQEVTELRETAARLAIVAVQPPPSGLRGQVLDVINQTRQELGLPHIARPQRPWARWTAVAAAAAVAACIALAALLGVQTARLHQADVATQQARAQYDRVTAVLTAPDAQISTTQASGATGTVVVSPSQHSLVLLATSMPALPADRAYQAWLIGPRGPESAGLITDPAHPAPLAAPLDAGITQVGISVEPAGGSDRPTTSAFMLIPLTT